MSRGRTDGDDCESCHFSLPEMMDSGPVLECHRYPPQIVPTDGELVRTFPQVDGTDWCGEFRRTGTERD